MWWSQCKPPSCKPCSFTERENNTVRIDFHEVRRQVSADADKSVSPVPVLGDDPELAVSAVQKAGRHHKEHLTDISLEYPYVDLAFATGDFGKDSLLGSGGAGTVYKGKLRGGTEVAVKVLADKGGLEGFEDEVRVLSQFRHPNVVTLLGFGQHGKNKYLIYELLHGGDLQDRLRKPQSQGQLRFSWERRVQVAVGAASGLDYMANSRPVCFHRDIKPANILLNIEGTTAKMADFGLAGLILEEGDDHLCVENICGTPGYCCPSFLQTGKVTEQSEAYSFGIVLLELLVNKPPALVAPEGDLIFPLLQAVKPTAPGAVGRVLANLDSVASWPKDRAEDVANIALSCVDLVPDRRPSFQTIVRSLRQICRTKRYPVALAA